jgi:ELWxxDGT repeat protein
MKKTMGLQARCLATLALACTALPVLAATLLRDLNTTPAPIDSIAPLSEIAEVVQLGSRVVFVARDDRTGVELYVANSASGPAQPLVDINPGRTSSFPRNLTVVGDVVYFTADDGTNGNELWRSDGTRSGTRIVADIAPGSASGVELAYRQSLTWVGGALYFPASDGRLGTELWRSDGTASGTRRVTDLCPGACDSEPTSLAPLGDRLLFAARPSGAQPTDDGFFLYSTDGTRAGTRRVGSVELPGGQSATSIQSLGALAVFEGIGAGTGLEPWVTDGSDAGTRTLADLSDAAGSTHVREWVRNGSSLYFVAQTTGAAPDSADSEVYVTDGTPTGTTRLTDIFPAGEPEAGPDGLVAFGSGVAFRGLTETEASIWYVGGPRASPMRLSSIARPDTSFRGASVPVVANNRMVFSVSDGGSRRDVLSSDGTVAGTQRIGEHAGDNLIWANGRHAFFIAPGDGSGDLARTDGTVAGTIPLLEFGIDDSGLSLDPVVVPLPAGVWFAADIASTGLEPWFSDGSAVGTRSLGELNGAGATQSSAPTGFVGTQNTAYFRASDNVVPDRLWTTDGTRAGTTVVRTATGDAVRLASDPHWTGTFTLFASDSGGLWRTDGTATNTVPVAPLLGTLELDAAQTRDGITYFVQRETPFVSRLVRTDGTSSGTRFATSLSEPAELLRVERFQVFTDSVVLTALSSSGGRRLWSVDRATNLATLIPSNCELGGAVEFVAASATNAFFLATSSRGRAICITDGTANGTSAFVGATGADAFVIMGRLGLRLVFATCPPLSQTDVCSLRAFDPSSGRIEDIGNAPVNSDGIEINGALVYTVARCVAIRNGACEPSNLRNYELWRTDGTIAGTRRLADLGRARAALPSGMVGRIGGAAIFASPTESGQSGLWRTDGTDAPPVALAEGLGVGARVLGDMIIGAGLSTLAGSEPFVIRRNAPSANDDELRIPFGTTSSLDVLLNDGAIDRQLDRTSVSIVSPPISGVASVDSATGRVNYSPAAGHFGRDEFTYTVRDTTGAVSNLAVVAVSTAAPSGSAPSQGAPTVQFSATPQAVDAGATSQLSWSSLDAESCTASQGWSGSRALSGSETTSALSATTTYSISCAGPGGSISASVTVTVRTNSGGSGGGASSGGGGGGSMSAAFLLSLLTLWLVRPTRKAALLPRFVHDDGDRVRQVQAAIAFEHRQGRDLHARQLRERLCR